MEEPKTLVELLWESAAEIVEPPQLCFILVNEPPGFRTGTLAFRHNCKSLADVVGALRQLADKLESGEADGGPLAS